MPITEDAIEQMLKDEVRRKVDEYFAYTGELGKRKGTRAITLPVVSRGPEAPQKSPGKRESNKQKNVAKVIEAIRGGANNLIDIEKESGLAHSTVYRLLAKLKKEGKAQQLSGGGWKLLD